MTQGAKRPFRQEPSLVKAALRLLGAMQRHGNHQQFRRGIRRKLGNCVGQHFTEPPGRGMHAVVFEGVDRGFHPAFIQAKSHGAHEGRRRGAAGAAQRRIG